jgi:hypothetical protein
MPDKLHHVHGSRKNSLLVGNSFKFRLYDFVAFREELLGNPDFIFLRQALDGHDLVKEFSLKMIFGPLAVSYRDIF